MEREALTKLAAQWQVKLKKKYQTADQILGIIEPYWENNPEISTAVLFGIIAFKKGINIKPHAKLKDDGSLKVGYIRAPRMSRRNAGGDRNRTTKPFDRVR